MCDDQGNCRPWCQCLFASFNDAKMIYNRRKQVRNDALCECGIQTYQRQETLRQCEAKKLLNCGEEEVTKGSRWKGFYECQAPAVQKSRCGNKRRRW